LQDVSRLASKGRVVQAKLGLDDCCREISQQIYGGEVMRWVGGLTALILGAAWATPLAAQSEGACAAPNALGVARTVKIDTQGGPWLGGQHGDPDLLRRGEVVLTFDDGPIPLTTRRILAALAAECTKATFLMVGRMAAAYPEMVRRVAAAGHTVGTHTWSHPNLALMAAGRMKGQIEQAISAVQKAAGAPVAPFFRYPYLSSTGATVAYLKRRNIAQLAVDIDSLDYLTRIPHRVVSGTMARLKAKGKGIILLHDIHASTARAVPELLARLKAEGYRVVHLRPEVPVESPEVAEASALEETPSALEKPPQAEKPRPRRRVRAKPRPPEDPFSPFGSLFE
jgi:peptidoglycan/xylan/chitin deacetylase (PgdA/CDA1 family)